MFHVEVDWDSWSKQYQPPEDNLIGKSGNGPCGVKKCGNGDSKSSCKPVFIEFLLIPEVENNLSQRGKQVGKQAAKRGQHNNKGEHAYQSSGEVQTNQNRCQDTGDQ